MDSRALADRVSSRIVGGRQAVPHSHPWQVLLSGQGKFCGGKRTLIRLEYVSMSIL